MITWKSAIEEAKQGLQIIESRPTPEYAWYAYKEGHFLGMSRVSREG